jgi:molybdopterin converting factor small subunit
MNIEILLFAALREIEGSDRLSIEVPSRSTFGDLRLLIGSQHPRLQSLLEASRFAAGDRMVADQQLVDSTETIALIPPVSGG